MELAPGAAGEYGSSSRATLGTCRALARTAWPSLTRVSHEAALPHTSIPVSCRLTNGYVVTVDFNALIKLQQSHKLPDRVSAMCTTKARHRRDLGLAAGRARAVTDWLLTVGVLLLWASRSSMSTCRTSPPSRPPTQASALRAAATAQSRSSTAMAWSLRHRGHVDTKSISIVASGGLEPTAGGHAPTCCIGAAGFARGGSGSQAHDRRVPRQGAFATPPTPTCARASTHCTIVPQVEWDDKATGFACSATDGYLYVHELLGA